MDIVHYELVQPTRLDILHRHISGAPVGRPVTLASSGLDAFVQRLVEPFVLVDLHNRLRRSSLQSCD